MSTQQVNTSQGDRDHGTVLLAVRKDTAETIAETDGNYGPLQVDATGNLRVVAAQTAADDDGNEVSGAEIYNGKLLAFSTDPLARDLLEQMLVLLSEIKELLRRS